MKVEIGENMYQKKKLATLINKYNLPLVLLKVHKSGYLQHVKVAKACHIPCMPSMHLLTPPIPPLSSPVSNHNQKFSQPLHGQHL